MFDPVHAPARSGYFCLKYYKLRSWSQIYVNAPYEKQCLQHMYKHFHDLCVTERKMSIYYEKDGRTNADKQEACYSRSPRESLTDLGTKPRSFTSIPALATGFPPPTALQWKDGK